MKQFLFMLGIIALCLVPLLFDKKAPVADGIEIHTNMDEQRTLAPVLNDALDDVLLFYQRKHGVELTRPQHIIFSQDSQFVADTFYQLSQPHLSKKNARFFARTHCDADQRLSGVMTPAAMLMCISPVEDVTNRWARDNYDEITATLTHEIMHALQYQMSAEERDTVSVRRNVGPIWMMEGHANLMARDFQGAMEDTRREFNRVFDRAEYATKSLRELLQPDVFSRFTNYGISHLAVFMLNERYGSQAVFDYWDQLSKDHGWENSFARAFNLPLSDFLEQFENVRNDRDAAWDWMQVTSL